MYDHICGNFVHYRCFSLQLLLGQDVFCIDTAAVDTFKIINYNTLAQIYLLLYRLAGYSCVVSRSGTRQAHCHLCCLLCSHQSVVQQRAFPPHHSELGMSIEKIAFAASLRATIPKLRQRAMDLAQKRGASSWLTTLPLEKFGLTLHKGVFRDAIALRYGWQPALIPSTCACGTSFSVEHALSFPMDGLSIV